MPAKYKIKLRIWIMDCAGSKKHFGINIEKLAFILLVIILIARISLVGEGFLAFPDETRYSSSAQVLKSLASFDIRAAIDAVFSTQGRPGDVIIKTIPNSLQVVTAAILNLNYYDKDNSFPLFFFNFFIHLLILFIHYRFSKLLLKNKGLAIMATLLFAALINSFLYLRHALPFDSSLLIFYLVIYKIVEYTEKNKLNIFKAIILGMICFFSFLAYPGYFPFVFISGFLLLFNNFRKNVFFERITYLAFFSLGNAICLGIVELIALSVGKSYIHDSVILSRTITQGSYSESFSFIFKYLFQVEGITGIILLIGLITFYIQLLLKIKANPASGYNALGLTAFIVLTSYLVYASLGYFLEKWVFYGRLLHLYFPFFCIFSVCAYHSIAVRFKRKEPLLWLTLSLIITSNFFFNLYNYKTFVYPRDVAWRIYKNYNFVEISHLSEYNNCLTVRLTKKEIGNLNVPVSEKQNVQSIICTNFCFYWPINDANLNCIPIDRSYVLVESEPHFMNFIAYQYEGFEIEERRLLNDLNLQVRIFKKLF